MVDAPLSQQDLDNLETRGWCRTRICSEELALKMQDAIWNRLRKYNVSREDKSTWVDVSAPKLSHLVRRNRLFRDAVDDDFIGAIDQLLGKGQWDRPKYWGMVLKTFPETNGRPWDVVLGRWHWHFNPLRNLERINDLFSFNFLSSVKPMGGGTLIIEGIHRVVRAYLNGLTREQRERRQAKQTKEGFYRYHPWIQELTDRNDTGDRTRFVDPVDVNGHTCRVVELTGEPGEAVITLAGIPHTRSRNCLDEPRFMRAVGFRRHGYSKGRLALDDE